LKKRVQGLPASGMDSRGPGFKSLFSKDFISALAQAYSLSLNFFSSRPSAPCPFCPFPYPSSLVRCPLASDFCSLPPLKRAFNGGTTDKT
jgi:hypothetical protein